MRLVDGVSILFFCFWCGLQVMLFDKVGGRLIRTIGPALVRATGGNAKAPQEQMISTCDVAFDSAGLYVHVIGVEARLSGL